MKMKHLLTDTELRGHWFKTRAPYYEVDDGTFVTPSAMDFLREHKIELRYKKTKSMTVNAIPDTGKSKYADALTGAPISEKGERMTHLRGNCLVDKGHPRIAFRGKLDTLMAQIILCQSCALQAGLQELVGDLQEIYDWVTKILGAEVKNEQLVPGKILGFDSEALRKASQNVRQSVGIDHPIPGYTMGTPALQVNFLRTQIRETELAAIAAFAPGENDGIIETLNRLSSAAYLVFCRAIAGYYGGRI